MTLKRLLLIKGWIEAHPHNGEAITMLDAGELAEVMRVRKKMGPAPIKLIEVIDKLISDNHE